MYTHIVAFNHTHACKIACERDENSLADVDDITRLQSVHLLARYSSEILNFWFIWFVRSHEVKMKIKSSCGGRVGIVAMKHLIFSL